MIIKDADSPRQARDFIVVLCLFALAYSTPTFSLSDSPDATLREGPALSNGYSPYANRKSIPSRPLFGDTHVHTGLSIDAGIGGTRLRPADAYRFARGEQITASMGQSAKLGRPLDFLAIADHSDNLGFATDLTAGKASLLANTKGREWYELIQQGKSRAAARDVIRSLANGSFPEALRYSPGTQAYSDAWQEIIEAADAYNEPGVFTAFIGYEWTSAIRGANMHRNVIFRDDGFRASQVLPFTSKAPGSANPIDLWNWMEKYEASTGGRVLAIPHNGNLSNGIMFPVERTYNGAAIDRAYAERRAKWERLYEVTQTKGDAESHPYLSPDDEFANFETWDKGDLRAGAVKEKRMLEFEYTRPALKNGLKIKSQLGVNPYKFGMAGGTDIHTALATAEEDNFFGKTAAQEPEAARISATFIDNEKTGLKIMNWELGSSGYTAVWAEENTRNSIWDAMHRRETYATTGTRMTLRFFGGWDFVPPDASSPALAAKGYEKGVAMGSDLGMRMSDRAPSFLIAAMKDPIGANLDRVQIVKGWMNASGETQEQIYNVTWSGDRKLDLAGKLPGVGSTVDIESATWSNTIGASELSAVWTDPDFDPSVPSFYYVRVIEIPTPRWTAYDAKRFGVTPIPGTRMTISERAYSSPIWYSPQQ